MMQFFLLLNFDLRLSQNRRRAASAVQRSRFIGAAATLVSALTTMRSFASDNYAGILPECLAALAACNEGHASAYGADAETARLDAAIEEHFGAGARAFPVFNGTAANVIALGAITPRWGAVVCAATAHVHADEGGAPEAILGAKLHTVPTPDGKLTPALLRAAVFDEDSVHRARAAAVTLTNTTELGTVYSVAEVRALADAAHALGLAVHMDGARLANAAAALGVPFRAFTTDAGVDILSLGGTKAGAFCAEAVVVLPAFARARPAALAALPFLRKTAMQLASKQRFIAAQLCALLAPAAPGDARPLCVARAAHANAMAARLDAAVRALAGGGGGGGVRLPAASAPANAVFPVLPRAVVNALRDGGLRFYDWDTEGTVRWMCSWDTEEGDVDALVARLAAALSAATDSPAPASAAT